jgi:hypothetical protein
VKRSKKKKLRQEKSPLEIMAELAEKEREIFLRFLKKINDAAEAKTP